MTEAVQVFRIGQAAQHVIVIKLASDRVIDAGDTARGKARLATSQGFALEDLVEPSGIEPLHSE